MEETLRPRIQDVIENVVRSRFEPGSIREERQAERLARQTRRILRAIESRKFIRAKPECDVESSTYLETLASAAEQDKFIRTMPECRLKSTTYLEMLPSPARFGT